jgi:hypothetical protein
MKSKFVLTVAAGLLAGTMAAAAQQSGAPAGEKDRTGQPADSSTTSSERDQPVDTRGQGRGTTGSGAVVHPRPPQSGESSVTEPLPGEPNRGAAPRQGEGSGDDAIPRRK